MLSCDVSPVKRAMNSCVDQGLPSQLVDNGKRFLVLSGSDATDVRGCFILWTPRRNLLDFGLDMTLDYDDVTYGSLRR